MWGAKPPFLGVGSKLPHYADVRLHIPMPHRNDRLRTRNMNRDTAAVMSISLSSHRLRSAKPGCALTSAKKMRELILATAYTKYLDLNIFYRWVSHFTGQIVLQNISKRTRSAKQSFSQAQFTYPWILK